MPLHFARTLETTGAKAEEIIHVGDHPEHDITAAQRLGWHTIWFNRDQQAEPPASKPTATVRHFAQLPACIRRIEGDSTHGRSG